MTPRALRVSASGGFELGAIAPGDPGPGELGVALELAGICRTDLHAARGRLGLPAGRVLGHEAAGRVVAGDPARLGQRVAIVPTVPCGACERCRHDAAAPWRCAAPRQLGVDVDGVFADRFLVPAALALPVPEALDPRAAAFVEPLAAALAVLDAPLPPGPVAVQGDNRIARLVARVIEADTGRAPARLAPGDRGRYAAVVETEPAGLALALAALAPGGTLIAKSRPAAAVAVDWRDVVLRELRVVGVRHGSFERAIRWLIEGRIEVADLLGASFPLADAARAFDEAEAREDLKLFLRP